MHRDEIIKLACKENAAAESFCRAWVTFAHTLDDLIDRDTPIDVDEATASLMDFIIHVSANPFFQSWRAQLTSLMVQSANAWLDSNSPKYNDGTYKSIEGDIIKGFYHEVVFHCAYLIGGWSHLRRVTQGAREYDYEKASSHPRTFPCDVCGQMMSDKDMALDYASRQRGHQQCLNISHRFAGCELPSNKY